MNVRKKLNVQKLGSFNGHRDCIYSIEKSSVPHHFFSAAGDGLVVRWNLQQPDQGEVIAKIPASVYALHYLPTFSHLWIGQNFDGVHIIDLHTKKEIKSIKLTDSAIFDIQSFQDKVFIATGDGTLIVMDARNHTILKQIKLSAKSARSIAINLLNNELAVGYSDNYIRIIDLESVSLKYAFEAHKNSVFTLQYSPDFSYLLSGSRDAHLNIWDTKTGYSLHNSIVAHMFAINHIMFSPSENLFLTCSMDKSIKVWDAATFQLLKVIDKARFAGHGTSVNKLLWTDYNDLIVSGSDDRTLSVWQLLIEEKQV